MEITKAQIARLVLGYLKSEKCTEAFNEFLKSSKYLKQQSRFIKNGKYFATRVFGLCLEDFLLEYAHISSLVQGRLEETNYYNENHFGTSLVDQLLYLLNHHNERSSTPPVSAELCTTSIESLPGNSPCGSTENLFNKSQLEDSDKSGEDISEVLSKTMLEKPGFAERIAESINTHITDVVSKSEIGKMAGQQLDQKLEAIIQTTTQDPIFEQLMNEIIGTQETSSSPKSTTDDEPHNSKKCATIGELTKTPKRLDDAVVCNGSIDNLMAKSTPQLTSPGQFIVGQNGTLLMIPTMNPIMPSSNVYLINNSTIPSLTSTPLASADQDIIIIKDDSNSAGENNCRNKKGMPKNGVKTSKIKTLLPKTKADQVGISNPDGQYVAVINKNGEMIYEDTAFTKKNTKTPRKASKKPRKGKKAEPTDEKPTESIKELKNEAPEINKEPTVDNIKQPEVESQIIKNDTTPNLTEGTKKSTPKSGSHVRNLNFCSPVKEDPSQNNYKPNASKTLFQEEKSTWDSDLRTFSSNKKKLSKMERITEETPVEANNPVNEVPNTEHIDEASVQDSNSDLNRIYALRNCNAPQKIRKKCNSSTIVSTYKVEMVMEEVPIRESIKITEMNEEKKELVYKSIEDELAALNSSEESKKSVVLKTPIKPPKTPTICESIVTPFSKILEDQLTGVDLTAIDTPKLPLTPSLPITPFNNRATDYSTSSSYYQPSDSEQNKSMEILIEESKRLEREIAAEKEEEKSKPKVQEIKKVFNQAVIGKKNLNLIKQKRSDSSSSDDSSSSSDTDSSEESASEDEYKPELHTERTNTPYSLRRRVSKIEKKPPLKTPPKVNTVKKNQVSKTKKNSPKTTKSVKNKPKTSKSPKEVNKKKNTLNKVADTIETDVTDEDFALHLSTDEETMIKNISDSSGKLEAQPTAEKLVQDLKERGIHLLPKITPPKDNPELNESMDLSFDDIRGDPVPFDMVPYDESRESHVIFDGNENIRVLVPDYNLIDKKIHADVYIEKIDKVIKRIFAWAPFETLFERLEGSTNDKLEASEEVELTVANENRAEKGNKDSLISKNESRIGSASPLKSCDDELMNEALTLPKDGGASPKRAGKRKSMMEEKTAEKKMKTGTHQELLKKINVDQFLNKLHGSTN